jgi:uncharacterized protein YfdQ (DUF2303 family)
MEQTNFNETVAKLALKSAEPKQVEVELPDGRLANFLMSSKDLVLHDLDSHMGNPLSINESKPLNKPDGFIDYINDFKGTSSCIFGAPQSRTPLTAILDYHGKDEPSWCRHQCELTLASTIPWQKWTGAESSAMSHKEFINFIKDNIQDVTAPEHAKLIESVMQFESDLKVKSKSKVEGHGESKTIDTDFKTSDVPEIIKVGLAPYRYVKHYEAIVRVSVREGERGVMFSLSITNKDRILEAVFDDLVEVVAEKTGLKVYI